MFIFKKGHQPGVYVPLRALFLVYFVEYIFKRSRSKKGSCIPGKHSSKLSNLGK